MNTLIVPQIGQNRGFGPFLHNSIVSVGFYNIFSRMGPWRARGADGLTKILLHDCAGDYDQFKEDLTRRNAGFEDASSCRQVALWMTAVQEGDVIVMRHTYEHCPFIPEKLKTLAAGSYKPVYALAKVVRRPTPDIVGSRELGTTPYDQWIAEETWAEVEFLGLGFIEDLEEGTRDYFSKVIQPTISPLKSESRGGKFRFAHREDFIRKARMQIVPTEFPGFTGDEGGE